MHRLFVGVLAAAWWSLTAGWAATSTGTREIPFSIESLPPELQQPVRRLLERPTISASGPMETFSCNPAHYYWLLEHPHRGVDAWRTFGAVVVPIAHLGNGHYSWEDETGSKVFWSTIARGAGFRAWYAHGKVRASKLMPFVPVQSVVIIHHTESRAPGGEPVIHHHADLYVMTESRALGMTTRLFGASANRVMEQGIEQMQFFFSGLSRLLSRYPERAQELLARNE